LETYGSKAEFLSAVSSTLESDDISSDVSAAVVSGISAADDGLRATATPAQSVAFNLRIGAWVVSDEDLPIIRAIGAVAAAVAASLATGGVALPLTAPAITELANLCWQAWRKGARLNSTQILVFGFLQTHGPVTVTRLESLLRTQGNDLSRDEIRTTLHSLTEFELNDGSLLALADRGDGDVWKALKV
jgi:hypothetical protein